MIKNRRMEVAELLLSIGAVCVSPDEPFTYTSGLKGPIYCDNRKILSHVQVREKIIDFFLSMIREQKIVYHSLAGLATAGIPHAAFLADRIKIPMIYIRGKAKEHGKQNQIEGDFNKGDKVILVEDLVNQAGSLKTAFEGATQVGLVPVASIAIVDYQMESSKKIICEMKIPLLSLTDFETIIDVCLEKGTLNPTSKHKLISWHKDPKNWIP